MKLLILFVGIFGVVVAAGPSRGKSVKIQHFEAVLAKFLELIPFNEIENIISEELIENEEFYTFVQYLQSGGFLSLIGDLIAIPEFENFVARLQTLGLDYSTIIDIFYHFLNIEQSNVSDTPPKKFTRASGIGNVVDKILAVLPLDKLAALFIEEYEHSKVFNQFINEFRSDEFFASINRLNQDPDVQALLAKASDAGIQIESYVMELYRLFKGLIGGL